ncbi:carbon storage regulator CsrA [Desulfobacula sp.]|uniref:carbon storage regulator CsrA n=1 Tax=Desulfobacula sp. TaxID=2593537 RepID=UPI0026289A80|nr:carbon storage regulator CsrA [Desulfobacula sp.]
MLVLTRKLGEKVKIGDHVYISILEIESGSVKIGIDAPREVTILRMELLEQVKNKNIESVVKEVSDIAQAAAFVKHKFPKE